MPRGIVASAREAADQLHATLDELLQAIDAGIALGRVGPAADQRVAAFEHGLEVRERVPEEGPVALGASDIRAASNGGASMNRRAGGTDNLWRTAISMRSESSARRRTESTPSSASALWFSLANVCQ